MSRLILAVSLCGLALAANVVRADEPKADDAKKIEALVENAIKAGGGAEKLAKFKGLTGHDKGTYHGTGTPLPYEAKFAWQFPDRMRFEVIGVFTMVVDKDKGWTHRDGTTTEMTKEQLVDETKKRRGHNLSSLLPLRDKENKLSLAGETKIEGRPAVGLKVTAKDQPDVTLWFDQENHLLVRLQQSVMSNEKGKHVDQEVTLREYKPIDGIPQATKYTVKHGDEIFVEGELSDVKIAEKLDDSHFAKP